MAAADEALLVLGDRSESIAERMNKPVRLPHANMKPQTISVGTGRNYGGLVWGFFVTGSMVVDTNDDRGLSRECLSLPTTASYEHVVSPGCCQSYNSRPPCAVFMPSEL